MESITCDTVREHVAPRYAAQMGNRTILPDHGPCWTCENFRGLGTRSQPPYPVTFTINCTVRGRFHFGDPDEGCKYWVNSPQPASEPSSRSSSR